MRYLKKIFLILILCFVGILEILIYRNIHLYYQAEKVDEAEKKIEILEESIDFYPHNDLIFYGLGRAYLDLAVNNLESRERSVKYFQKSISYFERSLMANPTSHDSHFNMAQSLLYLNYYFPDLYADSQLEFKRAVDLAGENSQIFYEVAKIFLSRWTKLQDDEKAFTYDILGVLMKKGNIKKIHSLFYIWEMNIKDYDMMRRILPEDPQILRIYAEFLGEKSLSLEERQNSLAKAEYYEYRKAKEEYRLGESELYSFRIKEAIGHFNSCLYNLKKINLYQNLTNLRLIDFTEFSEMQKSVSLGLAKCLIEQGKNLDEVGDYLQAYLSSEAEVSSLEQLESYLKKKGLIRENQKDSFNDLNRLYFELLLKYSQDKHDEIMRLGRSLIQSFVIIPEGEKEIYIRVLNLMGDSYRERNHFYEALDFYNRSLEIKADNLETLVKIRLIFKKMDLQEKIKEINEKIEKLLSSKEKEFSHFTLQKGKNFHHNLILDGQKANLIFTFGDVEKRRSPLISIFFNGHIIWENYLQKETLSLPVETKVGVNRLEIMTINRNVILDTLKWKAS